MNIKLIITISFSLLYALLRDFHEQETKKQKNYFKIG